MNLALNLLGIAFIVGSIVLKITITQFPSDDYYESNENVVSHNSTAGMIIGIVLGIAFIILGNSFVIIPTGYTGVKSTFGQINEVTLQNGANFKIPFIQKIEKVNNKQQDIVFEGQIWSETSERTALYYDGVTVTYQINPEKSAWIYANVSNYKENLVAQTLVASAIKTSSKELNSTDATNRGIIEPLSMKNIQAALDEKYGKDVVIINKVVIANTDFEDSYNQAIASKQTAQLAYEQQQIENKKKIEAAEADAKVKTTQAKAEADAEVIKAQGEADANKLLNDSITDKILQQMYLDKWDGSLPRVSLSDKSNAIVDIGNLVSDNQLPEATENTQ